MFESLLDNILLLDEGVSSARRLYVDTKKIDKETFDEIVEADLTPTKKYVEWMCREILKYPYSVSEIKKIVQVFDEYVEKGRIDKEHRDIYKYTRTQVGSLLSRAEGIQTKAEQETLIKHYGANKTYEDNRLLVVDIYRHAAAMLYGKGTEWCITETSPRRWFEYTFDRYMNFSFVIIKKEFKGEWSGRVYERGEKFAVGYRGEGDLQELRDENDGDFTTYLYELASRDKDNSSKSALQLFEEDLGIKDKELFNADVDLDGPMEDAWEAWNDATYDNVKDEIELLYIYNSDEYVWRGVEAGADKLPDSVVKEIADEVMEWARNEEHGELTNMDYESHHIVAGGYIEREELAEVLFDLEIIAPIKEEDDKEAVKRKDIPGQQKFSFADESIMKSLWGSK